MHTAYVLFSTAVVPGPVENLMPVIVDPNEPFVILGWDPPVNCHCEGDVRYYEVRLSNQVNRSHSLKISTTTSVVLTRENGLVPLTENTFAVRAKNTDGEGSWTAKPAHISILLCTLPVTHFCAVMSLSYMNHASCCIAT